MSAQAAEAAGYFLDWDGNRRSMEDPGGGYGGEVEAAARHVGLKTPKGSLAREATFYRDLGAIAEKGSQAQRVPCAQPWGARDV